MKKHHLFKLAALLFMCCAMLGCGKEDNPSGGGDSGSGSIYGTVTDFATGDPVRNANVQLRPSGETTLTGYDGNYEFLDVPSGTYSIKVTKEGYSDLIDDYDIVVNDDKQTKRDVQIRKLPSSLHIYDNENQNHEITELDFGADEGVTQKTFNIFNGGSQSLQYVITKPTEANWVSIREDLQSGTVGVHVTFPIIVTINRDLLADGNNTTTLLITSSADGGKELTIKARKSSAGDGVYELPSAGLMVQTEDLGCVDWSSAQLLCENSTVAGYNDWRLPTKEELMTLYSNREQIGGFVDERYWSSSNNGTPYYVDFSNGIAGVYGSSHHYNVRAVRTIEGPAMLPSVTTSTPTSVTAHTAICGGVILSEGSSDVFEYGVCYSSTLQNPNVNNGQIVLSQSGSYSFTCSVSGLLPITKYYVRAFATNEEGTSYGESVSFTTKGEFIELSSSNLMVQTDDLGEVNWVSAKLMCENSTVGGYNDWRLPTQVELMTLYNNRDYIGGFSTTTSSSSKYWSSSVNTYGNPVGVDFYNGSLFGAEASTAKHVRAVRTLNGGGNGGGNGQTYSYGFEDSWQGWQVIDADGDGNTWRRFYSTEGNIGHNGSVYTMGSESYINNVGALYPDNYLFSPQRYVISNGAKISFYVCAQDADYPAEQYGIAISTASNPTANSFVTIWKETLSAKVKSGDKVRGNRTQGNWYLKTIDLSAYAGQTIWIAIRHFGCTNQFVINVDDITIVTGN